MGVVSAQCLSRGLRTPRMFFDATWVHAGLFDLPVLVILCHLGQKLFLFITAQAFKLGFIKKSVAIRDPFKVVRDIREFYIPFLGEK